MKLWLSAGQISDYKGARALMVRLPGADMLLADRGYDADWFRKDLEHQGITPCIPARRRRKTPRPHDQKRYVQRHRIENMFARLKDWRRIATRYDRCAERYLSAVVLAATVIFWL